MDGSRRVFALGSGFLADSYDLFVIGLVMTLIADERDLPPAARGLVSVATVAGAIVGQVCFGFLADRLGRRVCFLATALLTVGGSLGSASVFGDSLLIQLAVWRFFLGLGIGGEYPLAASISAESSEEQTRGSAVLSVFAMQGVGMLLCPIVVLVLIAIGASKSAVWRSALAFGAFPSSLAFFFRLQLEETRKFTESQRASTQTTEPNISDRIARQLVGTAGSWALIDITLYGNGLLEPVFTELMGLTSGLSQDALVAVMIACIALPGYILSVAFIDGLGRKKLQCFGFLMLALIFGTMAVAAKFLSGRKFLFGLLYGLSFLFSIFGPNATTFLIPSEIFPTRVRATCHGISAASGKARALIGGALLGPLSTESGIQSAFAICAIAAAMGSAWTHLFIPDYNPAESQPDSTRSNITLDDGREEATIEFATAFAS